MSAFGPPTGAESSPARHRHVTRCCDDQIVGDLLDGYRTDARFDEMLETCDLPRTHYRTSFEHIQTLSRADFEERCGVRDRVFSDRGVTFAFSGEEERPFPLDFVPRILSAAEWSIIEHGVGRRVLALERFLADVYGPGEIVRERVVPRRLVVTSKHFHRARPDVRGWALDRVDQLVGKPVDGALGPRRLDLRPFALHDGEKVLVVPPDPGPAECQQAAQQQ